MIFIKNLLIVLFLSVIQLCYTSPIRTNCTSVESIDGSVGVECSRTPQDTDSYEPTVIQQHFVDLFSRAKRDTTERIDQEEGPEQQYSSHVSELFIQNLAIMSQANMSDCMSRVNCEEKCNLVTNGVLKQTDEEEIVEGEEELPQFVRSFYEAGKRGIEFGKSNSCDQCMAMYTNCDRMQFDYTIRTNALYNDLMNRNISLFENNPNSEEIPEDIRYLHHSMKFLDLANLTKCYARVSCETTCRHVKSLPNSEAPPETSPFLQNDPQKPESVDIIHNGTRLGFSIGHIGVCDDCADHYTDCPPERYTIAHSSAVIFG